MCVTGRGRFHVRAFCNFVSSMEHLEVLELEAASSYGSKFLGSLLLTIPSLVVLRINMGRCSHRMVSTGFFRLAHTLNQLRVINITNSTISEAYIAALVEHSPDLRVLTLTGVPYVSRAFVDDVNTKLSMRVPVLHASPPLGVGMMVRV